MKKFLVLIVMVLIAFAGNAQYLKSKSGKIYFYPYSNYVGIGTDSPTAPLDVVGAANFGSTVTVAELPTFTLASGQLTVNTVFDTVGVNITGLTTSSIVIVSYGEAVGAADTIASVYALKTGRLTVMGERGKKINYFVAKK